MFKPRTMSTAVLLKVFVKVCFGVTHISVNMVRDKFHSSCKILNKRNIVGRKDRPCTLAVLCHNCSSAGTKI